MKSYEYQSTLFSRLEMSVNNKAKLFEYISKVSTHPIEITFEDGRHKTIGDNINWIDLNATFFYSDNCFMCGCCCPPENNVFSELEFVEAATLSKDEYDLYGLDFTSNKKLIASCREETLIVNGINTNVYEYVRDENVMFLPNKGKSIDRCPWLFERDGKFLCSIHPSRSITCMMPHLRIYHRVGKDRSSIGVSQFGRNHQLGCKVKLEKPNSEEEFEHNKQVNLAKLNRLLAVSNSLHVETHLPTVIDAILEISYFTYPNYIYTNLLTKQRKLF